MYKEDCLIWASFFVNEKNPNKQKKKKNKQKTKNIYKTLPPPPKKKQGGVFICSSISRNKNINIVGGGEGNGVQKLQSLFTKQSRLEYARRKLFLNINDLFYINI